MTDWETCPAVEQTPGKVGGAWVFAGTRVPLFALYENLASGATVDDFVEWFPGCGQEEGSRGARTRSPGVEDGAGVLRLLFDQGTPAPLRLHLPAHSVDTLADKGWSDKDNGDLLELAEREGYEILVTTDRSPRYQQNLEGRKIGIVILLSADWPAISRHVLEIGQAIAAAQPGKVVEVPIQAR